MPNLPALIRPLLPDLAWRLERRENQPQEWDPGVSLRAPEAFDVELAGRGVERAERQLLLEVGRLQGRNEVLERASQEKAAIYEGVLARKHELALAHLNRGQKAIKWKYKMKRMAIKYGCIALAITVFAIWADHKLSGPVLAPSKPLPSYQSAVDR